MTSICYTSRPPRSFTQALKSSTSFANIRSFTAINSSLSLYKSSIRFTHTLSFYILIEILPCVLLRPLVAPVWGLMLGAYSEPTEFGGGSEVWLSGELDILNPLSEHTLDAYLAYGCLISKGFNGLNGRSGCRERDSACRRYASDFRTKYHDRRA